MMGEDIMPRRRAQKKKEKKYTPTLESETRASFGGFPSAFEEIGKKKKGKKRK